MNLRRNTCLFLAAVIAGACNTSGGAAQVDSYWLRSWEEAQATRPRTMSSSSEIAPPREPGRRFIIRGQVFRPDGLTPANDVIVHAYHRDSRGFDFGPGDTALPTWRLQGWAKTDGDGLFVFHTIRPAPDHMGREGAHVHFTLETGEFGRQWAHTLFLADDPLVTEQQRRQSSEQGQFGWVRSVSTVGEEQNVTLKIRLKQKADF